MLGIFQDVQFWIAVAQISFWATVVCSVLAIIEYKKSRQNPALPVPSTPENVINKTPPPLSLETQQNKGFNIIGSTGDSWSLTTKKAPPQFEKVLPHDSQQTEEKSRPKFIIRRPA